MAPADVQRIGEELHAVRAHVQRHRQGQAGMDARGRRVQRQLADRDGHATGTLVAQAQDPLVVRDHDQADLVPRGVAQDLRHAAHVVRGDPDAARPAVEVAELLACPAHGGRVDDRQQLFEVVQQDPVEQGLVPVLEGRQADVLLEVVLLVADMLKLQGNLLLDLHHSGRQQAAEAERVPFVVRERRVLVEDRVGQQCHAPQRDRRRTGPASQGVQHRVRQDVGVAPRRCGRHREDHAGGLPGRRTGPPQRDALTVRVGVGCRARISVRRSP